MRILILTAIIGFPLMALGQVAEPGQTTTQGQTKETQATAAAKGKKSQAVQEPGKEKTKSETGKQSKETQTTPPVKGKNSRGVQEPGKEKTKSETGTGSTTSKTKVNVQEFKSRHSEVFSLGRHPKEFFIERFGERHFRLIGQTYFVFVDGCWVAVDVEGFVFVERVICEGDPEFIEVVD